MMKKFLLVFVLVAALSVLAVSVASAEPAEVLDYTAGVIAFDGNGVPVFVLEAEYHRVYTNDDADTLNVTIKGTLPDGAALPDRAVRFETLHAGYHCTAGAYFFKYTLTPKGNFHYTCKTTDFVDD
jgi:hypothetical protein